MGVMFGLCQAVTFAQVQAYYDSWQDTTRDRALPVKIYVSDAVMNNREATAPLIVFSHGLGGSREAMTYLAEHLAQQGYVCVAVQHPGSDKTLWVGSTSRAEVMRKLKAGLRDMKSTLARPRDVSFVLDVVESLQDGDPAVTDVSDEVEAALRDRIDMDRVGMIGHSFGAWTTLAVSGQVFGNRWREVSFRDPRIKAAIPLSSPPAKPHQRDKAYTKIAIPMLHMTGTRDTSPISDTTAAERTIPFERTSAEDQYLIIFDGGDHMVFSGRGLGDEDRPNDAMFHDLIERSCTLFLDAFVRGDEQARQDMRDGGLRAIVGEKAEVQSK